MRRFIAGLAAACLFLGAAAVSTYAQETTWDAPPISTQFEMDKTIMPVGKGAVFCPAMTDPDNEPMYGVLIDGRIAMDARMGERIPLSPGVYTIVLGSGTVDQMIQKNVRVQEGATTLIKPDWSGLVIEVINQTRTNIREYYELFDLRTGNSYGIGQGVEEGLDESIRTWILSPGLYKIVKPGDNVNAVTNFGTVRVLPGELIHQNLVLESATGDFLGFGHITSVREGTNRTNKWVVRSELSGNALLNYVPTSESGGDKDASFTATVQWLTDARYESGRHVFPVWSNLEEGLSMDNNREIHKYIDKAELRFTYIFRLSDLMSPYLRVFGESRLFDTTYHFDEPTSYMLLNAAGDTVKTATNATHLDLGKSFSPIYLKEGFGVTSALIKTLSFNVNIRSGYGARQTYGRGSYIFNANNNSLTPVLDSRITGMEFLLLGDFRLGRYILFNAEFDMLMPDRYRNSWVYDGENRLRLSLTSNVSLLFKVEYWKDDNVDRTQTRYQTLLRFSTYL